MFGYFFSNVKSAGRYLITYLVNKNEYVKEVEFEADNREDLQDKWKLFAATNGLALMSITGIDKCVS